MGFEISDEEGGGVKRFELSLNEVVFFPGGLTPTLNSPHWI